MDSMVRRISRLAKALKWKIYHFLVCFFCASVDVGRFLKTRFRPWIHQPSESFGLTLATETTFNSNFCSKTARYRLFLAVVRCCVTTTLAAETFSLLSVYLNYKFGLGLPSFYLFFSLFKLVNPFEKTENFSGGFAPGPPVNQEVLYQL